MNVRVNLLLKYILTTIYAIGIVCVAVFSGMYLQHSTIVPNPDAMIPMMRYEIDAWRLIVGLPFMIASCISIVLVYKIKKVTKVIFVLLPAVVCLVMCISYFFI